MTNMTSRVRAVLAAAGLVFLAVALPAAAQVPDLTGVWTNYRNPNAPAGRGAASSWAIKVWS